MIIDQIENWANYFNSEPWHFCIRTLQSLKSDYPNGVYELKGKDIILKVFNCDTLPETETKIEAHDEYIDIQFIFFKELIHYPDSFRNSFIHNHGS